LKLFKSPLIYFGRGSLGRVETLKGERALIVTDKNIRKIGAVAEVEKHLQEKHVQTAVFDEVEPDPTDTTVSDCVEVAVKFKPDWFIGLGGGSPIDVAKGAFLSYERPDIKLTSVNVLVYYGLRKKSRIAAMPTTSGTGSEVSIGCAITETKTGRKHTLTSFELVPDVAIVDPQLAFKMPPKLRADTGLDVLAHALESCLTKTSNQFTNSQAIRAIQIVFHHLRKSVNEGKEDAMEEMHYAATLAGSAMSYSGLAISHSIGHAIGTAFQVPHGLAVGIALPYMIEYSAKACKDRYLDILRALGVQGATTQNSTEKLLALIRELMIEIKEPQSIAELDIDVEKFTKMVPTMAAFASADLCTFTSPRVPTTKDFTTIMEYMLKGKAIDF
jgi:alcohol dehydrogenase class IV